MDNKKSGLLKASLIVTIISIVGKVIGFTREVVIAAYYGADWETDVFFFAQSMPSIIFPAVCNSLSTAFLAVYVSKKVEDKKEADSYGSKVIIFSVFGAIILSIIAIILTPYIVPIFVPGFSEMQFELAISLTRITMSAFVLIMMQYMLSAILSAKKIFYGAQISALFYNICIIAITITLGKNQNIYSLTYTVIIGHIIQVIALCVFTHKNFKYSFEFRIFDSEIRKLLKLTFPIILGNSIVQINNIVDKMLSSLLGSGSVSALSYSNTLNRFVTGIIITTLSTVIYPMLAEDFSNNKLMDFSSKVRNGISASVIVLMPISIITTMCASDIVKIVYERGNFNEAATELTSMALMFYGMMFVFSAIQEVVTKAFYSMKDTKTPLRTAAIAIISNAVMSYMFSMVLDMGLSGIAIGTTLSTVFSSILLTIALNKKLSNLQLTKLKGTLVKILVSSIAIVITIIIMQNLLCEVHTIIRFLIITINVLIVYFGLLFILRCNELKSVKIMLKMNN